MWYIFILIFAVTLFPGPSHAGQYVSPLGEVVTDYCGTYEAVGATNPEKWLECRKEWERLKEQETRLLLERQRQQQIERQRQWAEYQRQQQELQRQEAERRWRAEQEERRTRALEEAARAQRDAAKAQREQAETGRRPPPWGGGDREGALVYACGSKGLSTNFVTGNCILPNGREVNPHNLYPPFMAPLPKPDPNDLVQRCGALGRVPDFVTGRCM